MAIAVLSRHYPQPHGIDEEIKTLFSQSVRSEILVYTNEQHVEHIDGRWHGVWKLVFDVSASASADVIRQVATSLGSHRTFCWKREPSGNERM